MRASFLSDTSAIRAAVEKLFDEKSSVLVEVRFPRMGTSPDWFLCENAAALNAILDRLGSGAEVHLNSVWDLKHPADAVVFRRRKQTGFQPDTETDCAAVRRLFDEKSPILVEAQFPSMGTSPD